MRRISDTARIALPRHPAASLARRLARSRARLGADRRGATAVEFALIALPFFALMGVIVQGAINVLAQQTLDATVGRAARLLRTGAFQDAADGSDPGQRMRRVLCGSAVIFFRCDDVKIDLSTGGSFSQSQLAPAYDTTAKNWASGFGSRFDCPAGNDVVSLRVAVPVLGPFSMLDFTGQPMPGGRQLVTSTAVFRTEPYTGKSCS